MYIVYADSLIVLQLILATTVFTLGVACMHGVCMTKHQQIKYQCMCMKMLGHE